jgi:Fe-S cluster assembly scaffold protein SufB
MQPFLAFLRAAAARYARRFLARRCRPVPAVQRRVFHVTTQSIRSPPPIFSASLKRMLASHNSEPFKKLHTAYMVSAYKK